MLGAEHGEETSRRLRGELSGSGGECPARLSRVTGRALPRGRLRGRGEVVPPFPPGYGCALSGTRGGTRRLVSARLSPTGCLMPAGNGSRNGSGIPHVQPMTTVVRSRRGRVTPNLGRADHGPAHQRAGT